MKQPEVNVMQRINVIGTSGSGKSTFGKRLAEILQAPYIEIDKIFWGPDWSFAPDEVFFSKLEDELKGPVWVLDGNYHRTTHIKWKHVQTVIWLDYALWRVMYRIITRTFTRAILGGELWPGTGNRETFGKVFSRDSMILWSWNTYHDNRKKYLDAMSDSGYNHIRFVRLSSPDEAGQFLRALKK